MSLAVENNLNLFSYSIEGQKMNVVLTGLKSKRWLDYVPSGEIHTKPSRSDVCFHTKAHLGVTQPHFTFLVATRGWCLPCWTAQIRGDRQTLENDYKHGTYQGKVLSPIIATVESLGSFWGVGDVSCRKQRPEWQGAWVLKAGEIICSPPLPSLNLKQLLLSYGRSSY